MALRPYTRSLHPDDYYFLQKYVTPLEVFLRDMLAHNVPCRDWHPHRFWEYGSILQQLDELQVPQSARLIDIGSGGSFFPPYVKKVAGYDISVTDSMKYGDILHVLWSQCVYYGIEIPLYALPAEDMGPHVALQPPWDGASNAWDVVMCISTIEHVDADKHDEALREICRITKPGGLIFITSDYFRDLQQLEHSPWKDWQYTPYMKDFVLSIPQIIDADFVGDTDLDYRGDFVHNYSFVNICLRKRPASTVGEFSPTVNGKG
jgi:SAM-dependent methyltransferase